MLEEVITEQLDRAIKVIVSIPYMYVESLVSCIIIISNADTLPSVPSDNRNDQTNCKVS